MVHETAIRFLVLGSGFFVGYSATRGPRTAARAVCPQHHEDPPPRHRRPRWAAERGGPLGAGAGERGAPRPAGAGEPVRADVAGRLRRDAGQRPWTPGALRVRPAALYRLTGRA